MKFGGTSVGSVEALTKVVGIVRKSKQEGHELVVVVSAMSGVTNLLLEATYKAEKGDEAFALQARADIERKHREATRHFLGDTSARQAVMAEINNILVDISL